MEVGAVRLTEHGGPDVLQWQSVELPAPAANEVQVRHHAVGLNYIDVYHRSGIYPTPETPCGIGMEAAGIVEAVGESVSDIKVGDRVAYASQPLGAYSEARNIASDRVVLLPDEISYDQGAAIMLQGMTVEYLLQRTYQLKSGDTVLFQAAAGGVGLLFCQWAKSLGARVIGTVGSEEKGEIAKAAGCSDVIYYRHEDVPARVKELTDGKGVPVVFDGIGKDTWEMSLASLAPRGLMVTFGNASGKVPPFDINRLSAMGSLYVTRPTLMTYTADSGEMRKSANDLFKKVINGDVDIKINQQYLLREAAEAHRALEARETTGSTIFNV